jgi:hypothetical protein
MSFLKLPAFKTPSYPLMTNKISKLLQIFKLMLLNVSFKTLLTLFLRTALPALLLITKPALKKISSPGFSSMYKLKFLYFLQTPFLNIAVKSDFLFIVSNFISIFLLDL